MRQIRFLEFNRTGLKLTGNQIPGKTELTSFKCCSSAHTDLLFMLVSRHRLPVVEMLAISPRLPIR